MVQHVAALKSSIDDNIALAERLEEHQQTGNVLDYFEMEERLHKFCSTIEKDSSVMERKMKQLGVEDQQHLRQLFNSAYLKLQGKMVTTKELALKRAIGSKFELERFDRNVLRVGNCTCI